MIFAYTCDHGDGSKHGHAVLHSPERMIAAVCPWCWRFMSFWYFDPDETDPEQGRYYATVPTLSRGTVH